MKRSITDRFTDSELVAFATRLRDWPRGLLTATLIPDAWMGVIERGDGRRALLAAGDSPRGEPDDMLGLVRNRRVTVPLRVSAATANCGNLVDLDCELLLVWPARGDDLAALLHNVLSLPELTLARLAELVGDGGGRMALQKFVAARPAERLVNEDLRGELLDFLGGAMQRLSFDCGFTVAEVATVHCTSRTLAERTARDRETNQRLERIRARETIETASSAAARRRLDDLSEIFGKLRAAAREPDQQWHSLLPALSPGERTQLLENLWRVTPGRRKAQAVIVLAGYECAWLDPQAPESVTKRVTLPRDLGGLRSVSFDPLHQWILVGAATGVWALDGEGNLAGRFETPFDGAAPRTGFNAAVADRGRILATHSTLGCWAWPLTAESTGAPAPVIGAPLLRPQSGTPRTVRSPALSPDGTLYFAADDCVYRVAPGSDAPQLHTSADATIHSLAVAERTLIVGTESGTLLRQDLSQPDDWWVAFRTNRPIETIDVREWDDLTEVLVPAGTQGVLSIFDAQSVITPLLASAHSLRCAWATDDLVIALSDLRDRLVLLPAARAGRIGLEVSLARLFGGAVQDVCLTWQTPNT